MEWKDGMEGWDGMGGWNGRWNGRMEWNDGMEGLNGWKDEICRLLDEKIPTLAFSIDHELFIDLIG